MEKKHDYEVPAIESILNMDNVLIKQNDSHGQKDKIHDIWLKLWTSLSFEYQFPDMREKSSRISVTIRRELEAILGMKITDEDCDKIRIHAINHAKTIMNKN